MAWHNTFTMFLRRGALTRKVVASVALALGAIAAQADYAAGQERSGGNVAFVAHRGGIVDGYPENTLAAFREAIRHGAEVIEIDLRGTKDGEIVIMHDETVDRTTNGRGAVTSLTLAELKGLDAGRGERIPTYEEVLQLVSGTGVGLLLDIKQSPVLDKSQVVRLAERHNAVRDVIVGPRNLEDLRAFRSLNPELRTLGFIEGVGDIEPFVQAGVDIVRLWPEWIRANPGLVTKVHKLGKPVWTTAGDAPRAQLEELIGLGVNGILSDLPAVMNELLASLRQTAQVSTPAVDPATVQSTVQSLATVVNREYFDPAVAARVAAALIERLAQGRYADIRAAEPLAQALTRDLLEITRDRHLAVAVVPEPGAPVAGAQRPAEEPSREVTGRRTNFGVQRVEILPGNVGYLNMTVFFRPDEARDTLAAAMRALRHADALILDMRTNAGGSPETAALLASYLFDAPGQPLFDIVDRSGAHRTYSTEASPVPERNGLRPVYILTSARTFSAGEGIAFILQERRRVEVVGDRTAGAANPGRSYPVNARFAVTVPNGQVRTAATGRNWEGTGVVPDIPAAADGALRVAHVHALRRLVEQSPTGAWRDTLVRELGTLEKQSP